MRILIRTAGSPELAQLARRLPVGTLAAYILPSFIAPNVVTRSIGRLPVVGKRLANQLGRRSPPPGIDHRLLRQASPLEDLLLIMLGWMQSRAPRLVESSRTRLMHRRNRLVAGAAPDVGVGVNVLVASHGTALEAFQRVDERVIRVLNFPSVHHRSRQVIVDQLARERPKLANTLSRLRYSDGVLRRYDEECSLADFILVGSGFAASTFVDNGVPMGRLRVNPYGVAVDRFVPDANHVKEPGFHVLYVGQIGEAKGIGDLLTAYRAFRRQDTTLTLVGSHLGDPTSYEQFTDLYRHVGHVPHEELSAIYRRASVFVFPTHFEGLGMVALEAMASGLPVIVTDRGPDEVVRDEVDGFVVPVSDPDAIADRLARLYADPGLLASMGASARARALEYSWEHYARRGIELLEAIHESGR